jgi:hypothetical protein
MSRKRILYEAVDVEEAVTKWAARYIDKLPFREREDEWLRLWRLLDGKKVTYDVKREATVGE